MKRQILLLNFILLICLFSVQAGSVKVTSSGQLERADSQVDPLSAVYVCNDFSNVTIEFTGDASSSTILQWYEYDNSGASPTLIQGESLNTLKITQGDKGYMVNDGNENYWIWIVDYQVYKSKTTLSVQDNSYPCDNIGLNAQGFSMNYYTPLSAVAHPIDLGLFVQYDTKEFKETDKQFLSKLATKSFSSNGIIYLSEEELPLVDTKFSVYDKFATKWNLTNPVQTDTYKTSKVAVAVLYEHNPLNDQENNMKRNEESVTSLTGTAPYEIIFNAYANEPIATYFSWTISDSLYNKITTFSDNYIRYVFNNSGTYHVKVEVSNSTNTCVDSASFEVNIHFSDIKVPNAFSPGTSPGVNDEFRVAYQSIVKFNCWIFNRWGNQLYHWTDPAKGWDGKVNGKYVVPGVYFYVIEAEGADGIKYKKKGDINVFSGK